MKKILLFIIPLLAMMSSCIKDEMEECPSCKDKVRFSLQVQEEGVQVGTEGCLSCPGKYGIVSRPMRTKVKALDRNGNEFVFEGEELISRALCHEYDHLDGVLYVDKASEIFSADARDFKE